ncbi:MAG: hypothetical protein CVU71_12520 [Deltaproteobacteria bacterium HGW-Deltaproteobacteria-6]|nr:MAG: hypothetical protein CVU71_12520 [Deltaproteobacteria bacterium HGW-Deltaproteobacteria-6]
MSALLTGNTVISLLPVISAARVRFQFLLKFTVFVFVQWCHIVQRHEIPAEDAGVLFFLLF